MTAPTRDAVSAWLRRMADLSEAFLISDTPQFIEDDKQRLAALYRAALRDVEAMGALTTVPRFTFSLNGADRCSLCGPIPTTQSATEHVETVHGLTREQWESAQAKADAILAAARPTP